MGFFISDAEIQELQRAPQNSKQQELYRIMKDRTERNTKEDCLVQSSDTQEWYHLVWERMSDATFVWAVERSESLGRWIRNRTLELVRLSQDDWIGPWYRNRGDPKPIGALETSHIALAVCEAHENCNELFTEEELQEIRSAIRDNGMNLCREFCEKTASERKHINNWFVVILNGFGTCALVLDDKEAIEQAIEWTHLASGLYNSNDYGESIQYSNYSNIHLAHLNEVAIRKGINPNELEMSCYTKMMPWYAASFLHNKHIDSLDTLAPRTLNFGDSGAIFRPSGDVLAHISSRMKDRFKREAGLARWLLDTLYDETSNLPDELASFGFVNQFQYHTILLYMQMAQPLSPLQATLSEVMTFEGGHVIARDKWDDTRAVVAMAAGYQPYNVTSHRHLDQCSFQLVIGKERMLIDPGHCCYRLSSQRKSVDESSHNTFSIWKDGKPLKQKSVSGNIFTESPVGNERLYNQWVGDVIVVASDMAKLYGDIIKKASRFWIMKLPHMMFVIDVVEADEPVGLCSHFVVNNRNNELNANIYSPNRLVFRRGEEALKLFEIYSETDGQKSDTSLEYDWTYVHDFYHPLPNQIGQGKEGSGLTYLWKSKNEGKKQIRIHTLAMDREIHIKKWHVIVREDGFIRIESPDPNEYLDVSIQGDEIIIRQPHWGTDRVMF
ncbi:MAG: hypothetical protein GX783_13160 [Clostridiales bacterium]|nr:hypothetical protein [Clostridiales bacterium]